MSNLDSLFDILRGWPDGSALDHNFPVVSGTLTEGDVVKVESSAPVGTAAATTVLDPAVAPAADIDVFVDPHSSAALETAVITDDHLLDTWYSANADMNTLAASDDHIFDDNYAGAKTLRGVIGEKRLRTTSTGAFTTARAADALSYMVRDAILKSEDAASTYLVADADAIATTDNGGGLTRITKTGAFTSALVGDIGKISGGATAGNNGGFMVVAVDGSFNYIDVQLAYSADANTTVAGFAVQVYHPVDSATDATAANATQKFTKVAAFANTAIGDIAIVTYDNAAGNVGMWYVSARTDDEVTVEAPAGTTIADEGVGVTNISIFTPLASRGAAEATTRKRLTRLVDTGATFAEALLQPEIDYIVMPWPANVDPTHWDTTVTRWPIETVVSDTTLDAELGELEELGPEDFIAGYTASAPYRIDVHHDRPAASKLTSATAQHTDGSMKLPDYAWLVTQGNDQSDGSAARNVAALRSRSGAVLRVQHDSADTLVPGDLLSANAGVLEEVTRTATTITGAANYSDHKQPVAMVLESNGTAGSTGWVVIVTV